MSRVCLHLHKIGRVPKHRATRVSRQVTVARRLDDTLLPCLSQLTSGAVADVIDHVIERSAAKVRKLLPNKPCMHRKHQIYVNDEIVKAIGTKAPFNNGFAFAWLNTTLCARLQPPDLYMNMLGSRLLGAVLSCVPSSVLTNVQQRVLPSRCESTMLLPFHGFTPGTSQPLTS